MKSDRQKKRKKQYKEKNKTEYNNLTTGHLRDEKWSWRLAVFIINLFLLPNSNNFWKQSAPEFEYEFSKIESSRHF